MKPRCAECGAEGVELLDLKDFTRRLPSDRAEVKDLGPGPFCSGCMKVVEVGLRQLLSAKQQKGKRPWRQ